LELHSFVKMSMSAADGDTVGPHLLLPLTFQPILQKEYADILQLQFNKRYTFTPGPHDPPPKSFRPYRATYWRDDRLQSMKQRLNETKSQLNNMPLQRWHKHTKRLNPASRVAYELRRNVQPELLTQAWEKFHECFHVFSIGPKENNNAPIPAPSTDGDEDEAIPTPSPPFNSVHLCEAPGAFITSLNHALSTHHPGTTWNWLATTLNPHYEGNDLGYMINDDRFIMGSLEHWKFGTDDTGNLMTHKNFSSTLKAAKSLGDISLVTADGSIDCQGDPGRQESIVADLHMAEALTALNILHEGGSLVLKLFTMFESETVCLLYLLSLAFQTVDVFKPATSKEGNSEVYVICRGYTKTKWVKDLLDDLEEFYGDLPTKDSLFSQEDIPSSFINQIRECAEMFMQIQENVIENNLHYFRDKMSEMDNKDLSEIQLQVAEKFMELYKVEKLPPYRHVVYKRKNPYISHMDAKTDRGTYLEKLAESHLEPSVKLRNIRNALAGWKIKGRRRFIEWVPAPVLGQPLDKPVTGLRLNGIKSSKFCTGSHLELYNCMVAQLSLLETGENETGEPKEKRRKVADKSYQGQTAPLNQRQEGVKSLQKLSKILPDVVEKSQVLTLHNNTQANFLSEECKTDNQIRLISTIIEAVTGLERGQHLLVSGFPLYTRLCMAIFFCLSSLFEETGFLRPFQEDDFVFLSNFLGGDRTADQSLQRLEDILTTLITSKTEKSQVLSVWSVCDLVQEPLYSEIVLFNQLRIKEKVIMATQFLEPKETLTQETEVKE